MKHNNKIIFFLLLIPVYLSILTTVMNLVLQLGDVYWPVTIPTFILCVAGAWLLSNNDSMPLNALGLVCFLLMGGYQALSHLILTSSSMEPLKWDVGMGCLAIVIGIAAFVYQIIARKRQKKS